MYIRHILIVIVLFFAGKLQAQDSSSVGGVLAGNWKITRVETKTYSQQDRRLLQEKVLTGADAIRSIRGFVPLRIVFQGHDCRIEHNYGVESGIYATDTHGHLWYKKKEKEPLSPDVVRLGLPWNYNIGATNVLAIEMPPSYYNENGTNTPVKLVFTCYYEMAN
ncbi:MAG: hypothetical protein J7623_15935 [Chitinophaga sp.]|uniref:hypothetical protein n=1 Tax=Chitinophaga sp. TaxID=1869181 RepID=UPI001B08136C|nr:hypothetical protein [Chitinophaga sp.]MBO9730129.1 hypothetical protein [Chitinophaga sp.]